MPAPLTATQTTDRARSALQSGKGAGLPELLKLIEALTTDIAEATINEIAELIERDPVVMSRLLTIANTVYHNPNIAPLVSIHHAIHQVGFQRIRHLAVSLMLLEHSGGAGNLPEQREAATEALCAGLLAQGCARAFGTVDPETAFACAALRQFGRILLPAVSLEHYAKARERLKTKPEDVAWRGLFGITPLELSRRLLGASRLPEEVMRSLRDCDSDSVGRMPLSNDSRLLGMADLGCRLAGIALDSTCDSEAFGERTRLLARKYHRLLPEACEAIAPAFVHANDHIASFARCAGVASPPSPSLARLRSRVPREESGPVAVALAGEPVIAVGGPIAAAAGESAGDPADKGTSPVDPSPTLTLIESVAVVAAPPAEEPWTATLARSAGFATQDGVSDGPVDPWMPALTLLRDRFGADEAWLFLPKPAGDGLELRCAVGAGGQRLRPSPSIGRDERTVFGVCISRNETVVIHNTADAGLQPYLPDWLQRAGGKPGAFLLVPTAEAGRVRGVALIGWQRSQPIAITSAQTGLIRQLLASVGSGRQPAAATA